MKKLLLTIGIAALVLFSGCGKDSGSGPSGPTAAELTGEGWVLYDTTSYDEALAKFEEAIDTDSTYYEAYLGRGLISLADASQYSETLANSDLQNVIYNNRTAIINEGLDEEVLNPAYAAMLGYKVKSTANFAFINTNLYTTLNNIPVSWEFIHNNGDVELNGAMVHLNLAEMYFYYPSATESQLQRAKTQLDMVRNWGGYVSMAQYLKDKADALYSQMTDAGLYSD